MLLDAVDAAGKNGIGLLEVDDLLLHGCSRRVDAMLHGSGSVKELMILSANI